LTDIGIIVDVEAITAPGSLVGESHNRTGTGALQSAAAEANQ
jgi:hypothetical protein